jgi:hypothetical protein
MDCNGDVSFVDCCYLVDGYQRAGGTYCTLELLFLK